MFFSVSMPIYNAEKYLDRSIQAIINQDYNDFELILVNDGSKDASLEICREWEKRYPSIIRVIDKENSGSLITRRRCITESKGDYLFVVDADDVICNKSALRIIKEAILNSKADMVVFPYMTDKEEIHRIPYAHNTMFHHDSLKNIYRILLEDSFLNPLWNKVFSRELVDWDDENDYSTPITNGTDLFQTIPIVSKAQRIIYIDEPLYMYTLCDNETSIIHSFRLTTYSSMKTNYERLCSYSKEWEHQVEDYERLIKRRMMLIASTSAAKTRLNNHYSQEVLLKYLREIGEDPLFRENYSLRGISLKRKMLVSLLFFRKYKLLLCIFHTKAHKETRKGNE